MQKLTENLIQQRLRTCSTDLDKVLQINITGRELQDVSLLRKMTNVEILSLSVNKISSLVDFQNCKNLKELYLRQNNIRDLNELYYLKNLPRLELLLLSENPCTDDPLYRMTVIKNLKNLVELDGLVITMEERKEALKTGKDAYICSGSVFFGNYIPDGPQIQRTPTHSSQKLRTLEGKNVVEIMEAKSNFETVNEDDNSGARKNKEMNPTITIEEQNNERQIKSPSGCEVYVGKGLKFKSDFKGGSMNCEEKPRKPSRCKFCTTSVTEHPSRLNCDSHCIRLLPKSSNILSAVLSLLKELDYPSLQIINAEVISRLNCYQIDLLYHS